MRSVRIVSSLSFAGCAVRLWMRICGGTGIATGLRWAAGVILRVWRRLTMLFSRMRRGRAFLLLLRIIRESGSMVGTSTILNIMAGDWIKFEKTTSDKTEIGEIAARLNMDDPDFVIGKLVRFWAWVDSITNTGELKTTYAFIDRMVYCPGFARALAAVGWLEGRDGLLSIPNFDRHNGRSAKARSLEAEAKRLRRSVGHESDNMSDVCRTNKDSVVRPEKRRKEKNSSPIGEGSTRSHERGAGEDRGMAPPTSVSTCRPSFPPEARLLPRCVDEVEAYFRNEVACGRLRLLPDRVREAAERFFNTNEGSGWLLSSGLPIQKWRPIASNYALRYAENEFRFSAGGNEPVGNPMASYNRLD